MEQNIYNILKQFVLFYEEQDRSGCVDGAYDPFAVVESVKKILDDNDPDWRIAGEVLAA